MSWKMPNEHEKKKLEKMANSFVATPVCILSVIPPAILLTYIPDEYSILAIILAITFSLFLIALLLNHILFQKCPRCDSFGTVPRGNCASCGMYLDPKQDKESVG